ncbi:unnamed protein product [Linum trigynum]
MRSQNFRVQCYYVRLSHLFHLISFVIGISLGTVACLYLKSFTTTLSATITMYHVSSSSSRPLQELITSPPRPRPPPCLVHNMSDEELLAKATNSAGEASPQGEHSPKLAFLFLTHGPLPFSPLWETFFRGSTGLYSIYVHPHPSHIDSWPQTSPFYGTRIPSKVVQWGSSTMVDAERRLLASALLDPSNQRFVLLSESCVPLFDFATTYRYLMDSSRSFLSSYDDPRSAGRGRYNPRMQPAINATHWRKGSQWFELDRDLALRIVSDRKYYKVFEEHCRRRCYMDEHYIPTLVNMLWAERSWNRSVTWVDWSRSGAHPRRFGRADVTDGLLNRIKHGSRCIRDGNVTSVCYLFARKFSPDALEPLLKAQNSSV